MTGHVADSSGLAAFVASDSGFGCSIDPSEAVATEAAAARVVAVGHAEVAAVLLVGLGTAGCEPSTVSYPHWPFDKSYCCSLQGQLEPYSVELETVATCSRYSTEAGFAAFAEAAWRSSAAYFDRLDSRA